MMNEKTTVLSFIIPHSSFIIRRRWLASAYDVGQTFEGFLGHPRRVFRRAEEFLRIVDDAEQFLLHDRAYLVLFRFAHLVRSSHAHDPKAASTSSLCASTLTLSKTFLILPCSS